MKKNLIIPLVIASLSVGFVIISFLVIATKGNNASFISKKLKIGGLILAMTAMFYACSSSGNNDIMCYNTVENNTINNNNTNESDGNIINNNNSNDNELVIMCYDVAEITNNVYIYNTFEDGFIVLNKSESRIIKGEIEYVDGFINFSYAIREAVEDLQKIGETHQIGDIDVPEIENNIITTDFEIIVDENLKEGNYHLFFYEFSSDKIKDNPNNFLTMFNLRITK